MTVSYVSVWRCRNAWKTELETEAVWDSVRSGDSITIHNVAISWMQQNTTDPSPEDATAVTAMFHLPMKFCLERMIRFESNEQKFQRNRT